MSSDIELVMVPGSLCDQTLFAAQIDGLDHRVTVGDITRSDSIEGMADDVLQDAPPVFALAGLSLGGIVAAEIVDRAPERVVGLALLDTNLGTASNAQISSRQRWERDVRVGHFASIVSQELLPALTAFPDAHESEIFDMAVRVGTAAFLRQNTALVARRDRRHILESVHVPTLILNGELDTICPTVTHIELLEFCPGAIHEVIPNAGHLSTIDQPDAVNDSLRRWLQTCNTNKHLQEGTENEYNNA